MQNKTTAYATLPPRKQPGAQKEEPWAKEKKRLNGSRRTIRGGTFIIQVAMMISRLYTFVKFNRLVGYILTVYCMSTIRQ